MSDAGKPQGKVPPLPGPLVLPGDRIPNFVLPDSAGELRWLYDLAQGRPALLVLVANSARQDQWDEIKSYADVAPALGNAKTDLIIVSNDGVESMAMVSKVIPPPAIWLADIKGVINTTLRVGAGLEASGVVSFLLDADQRVVAHKGPEPGHGAWALSAAKALPAETGLVLGSVAPILILPRTLDRAACADLLARCAPSSAPVPLADASLAEKVSRLLLRRVGPEVDKVFSFDDFRFEALGLQQEEAGEAGVADRRRDNSDPEQTGRSFSLLLDLDAAAYEGGGVRFPEYGPHLYRPETGAALVHAGGLLRVTEPITAGRRSRLTLTLRRPLQPPKTPAA